MNQITRTTRQLDHVRPVRPSADIVDGEYRIERPRATQNILALLYGIIWLLILTTGASITYCSYLLMRGI